MTKKTAFLLICTLLFCTFFPYLPPLQVAEAVSITKTAPSSYGYEIARLMNFDKSPDDWNADDPAISTNVKATYHEDVTWADGSRTCDLMQISKVSSSTVTVSRTFTAPHDVYFSTIIPQDELYLVLDIYVDNTDFASTGALEISSGGKADTKERNWQHSQLGYTGGWNTIYIPLSHAYGSYAGDIDYGHINYCRWYTTSNSSAATYYFQSLKLMWYPSSQVTQLPTTTTTKSGSTTIYNTSTNKHTSGTYNYYSNEKKQYDASNPNQLLLADFTTATAGSDSISDIKAVGSNTGFASTHDKTVTAKVEGGGTIDKATANDAYNYLVGGSSATSMLYVKDDTLANDSTNSKKWGYTIKIPLGKHVDLTAYTHICFTLWMSSYHYTTVNGVQKVIPNTPGTLQVNLSDSTRTGNPSDGINTDFNIGQFPSDEDGNIHHGVTLQTGLYQWGYTNPSTGKYYSVKKPRTGIHPDTNNAGNGEYFVTTIGAIDTIVIRFYVPLEHEEITAAPTIYLGKIWAECKTDTIQLASPISTTYESEQYSFMKYTPPTIDPTVTYNTARLNRSVYLADNSSNPRNVYIRGLSYGDHRFSVAYMSWPWRFSSGLSFGGYTTQSVHGNGGSNSWGWTRKNSQWLSYNTYQRFGGTSAAATTSGLTAVSN